ncbi:hypothetical protein MMC19_004476 [Ptychographa xylographoides]|nr:hypothetical protein [Ptychographa xylographoides]
MATASTVTNLISAFTTTGGGPIAAFTGQALLTESCTIANIATYSFGTNTLEYPWVGCSPESPECCPFDLSQEGPLTVCPTDYFTTISACCPSGWSLLPTPLLPNLTPCYTTPALALVPPSAASSSSTLASTISSQLFTLRYTLTDPPTPILSLGAKIGIAVGSAGFVLLLALLFFLTRWHRHAQKNKALLEATIVRASTNPTNAGEMQYGPINPHTPHTSPIMTPSKRSTFVAGSPGSTPIPIPELPSSPSPSYWGVGGVVSGSGIGLAVGTPISGMSPPPESLEGSRIESPGSQAREMMGTPVPIIELPGSTYMHEHHPIYVGSQEQITGADADNSGEIPSVHGNRIGGEG